MTKSIKILAFGIVKEIFHADSLTIELEESSKVADLKNVLEHKFPLLKQLASYMVAINNNYALDTDTINEKDEIAIIPPVSGG